MIRYVFSFLLLFTAFAAIGQKKSIVNLVHSKSSSGIKLNGKDVIKVYQGTFKQDYSTLSSDSAYFYPQDNAFDAFGHVNINQGDTLNIYSDKLNYNGNTKIAILTDNVRMIDRDATLTTNHLTYNTATRIGIYTDGGKLVNKENTLLSKNGYYFAFSRDSYFRYDVSLTTPDALIKTDTLRYNTGSKIAYFYGPTNIYSTKKEKDRDTLYTENGTYNTGTEQANFGKKNLYRSGTKSLKGDSLFYDKIKGFGRAIGHVTFTDKEQKTTIKGNLGTYFKPEELTIMTNDPYVTIVTEQKDTTKADSAVIPDSVTKKSSVQHKPQLQAKSAAQNKNAINMAQVIKNSIPANSIPAKIDSVAILPKDLSKNTDSLVNRLPVSKADVKNAQAMAKFAAPALKNMSPGIKNAQVKNIPAAIKNNTSFKTDGKARAAESLRLSKDTSGLKRDSIYISGDTIETQILTYKNLKIYKEKQRLAHIRDTTSKSKPKIVAKPETQRTLLNHSQIISLADSSYRHREYFGKPKPLAVLKKPVKPLSKKQILQDSLNKKRIADSAVMAKKLEPADTARIRILIVHHHAKLFKSDLQAKADSMFYANSDSTVRCYVKPMIWSEGSQLSGDTVYLQMKNKKLDNMLMFPSAFIVNVEKNDTLHFNQIGGKVMQGFFKDSKLNRMYISGNAESIYFSRDSAKNIVDGMQRSLSSRIKAYFKDNKVTNLGFYTKPQNVYTPILKVKEDDKILKGFIWKPKDRPISKESIIPSYYNKKAPPAKPGNKGKNAKPGLKKLPNGKTVKDTSKAGTLTPALKAAKDSLLKAAQGVPGGKALKDSLRKVLPVIPGSKTGKDSILKNLPALPVKPIKKDSAAPPKSFPKGRT